MKGIEIDAVSPSLCVFKRGRFIFNHSSYESVSEKQPFAYWGSQRGSQARGWRPARRRAPASRTTLLAVGVPPRAWRTPLFHTGFRSAPVPGPFSSTKQPIADVGLPFKRIYFSALPTCAARCLQGDWVTPTPAPRVLHVEGSTSQPLLHTPPPFPNLRVQV